MRLPEAPGREMLDLMDRQLAVIDVATMTEQALLDRHGENWQTLPNLTDLAAVREEGRDNYPRLSDLLLTIAGTLPEHATDAVRKLRQTAVLTGERIESALLIIDEVKRFGDCHERTPGREWALDA
ncbi:MAG: hypothetical protein KME03_06020 [Aphanocapsa lilacina HA4352-LM1]|jgi:hypothetical protein|nr:hypothetical protein [Aphanocapsa lilacina HA4352-LM1]